MFLLPWIEFRPTQSNINSAENDDYDDGDNDKNEDTGGLDEETDNSTSIPRRKNINMKNKPMSAMDEALLNALSREDDEDTNFALYIVPPLRELSAEEKLDAKIQIVSIFKQL